MNKNVGTTLFESRQDVITSRQHRNVMGAGGGGGLGGGGGGGGRGARRVLKKNLKTRPFFCYADIFLYSNLKDDSAVFWGFFFQAAVPS